jgi:hypothetical protein
MRTAVGILIVLLVLAPLTVWAIRGLRRLTGSTADGPRSPLLVYAEGLIVLAAIVLGVFVVVALATTGD